METATADIQTTGLLLIIFRLFTTTLFKIGDTSISLISIFALIVSLVLVVFIARTVGNLLKHKILLKLGIDEGNREAIAVIVRYLTIAIGLIIVLEGIGFDFASLAVIAGGLGIGIGFGIQDFTTNFFSGLTLLLDRPIKVGDYVELDGLSGTVNKISIRSTIINTNEDSSVIVPNSDMISSKIVNWSYANPSCCLHIPIDVADNSNPLLVTETLLNTAYTEPSVLRHPNPKVLFVGFGDACFKFELLAWINRPNQKELIQSSLNFAIEYNLRQRKISLPGKPRDLWIRNPEVLNPFLLKQEALTETNLELTHPSSIKTNHQQAVNNKLTTESFYLCDYLRQVKYFEHFNDLEIRQLIEAGYQQNLGVNEFLFRENEPGDTFYLILSGSVEVFVDKINKHLSNLHTGQFFGEISLMLGIPRTASVRALTNTTLFAINKTGFQTLLKKQPQLSDQIIQELSKNKEELAQRQQQLRDLGLVDMDEDDQNPVIWVKKRLKTIFSI